MTPSARAGMSASYDREQNLLVVFGGRIGTSVLADTWVLRNANGSGGRPPGRNQRPRARRRPRAGDTPPRTTP